MSGASWWRSGTIYQVYPRSFQDSDGDGVGDLRGIARRLDYLQWLGVDAIWISPIFPSPMADFGYDVADYCGIDPLFGTLADFDALLAAAHERGLKLILDFVPNHTSDRHPWFEESRRSRTSPKRDWYIWRDAGPDGGPPNNWISNFGGSAWQWDEATRQFYYHAFLKEQPDLDWRNPAVREAMYEALRFWLRRGVDGFRVDVIWHLIKDAAFRDNPPNPAYEPGQADINRLLQVHSADQPEVLEVVAEMRAVLDEFGDRLLIGEIYLPLDRLMVYYGPRLSGAHLPFNFLLLQTPWRSRAVADLVGRYEAALPPGGWPNWVLGNHDQPRVATRVGPTAAASAAVLLLTLRGTPTLYYGDELGLENVPVPHERARDPWERNEPGLGRDPQRTPMPWDGSPLAGFSGHDPWLPLGAQSRTRNVADERADPGSLLSLHRRLLALRRERLTLSLGDYRTLHVDDAALAFERRRGDAVTVVAINFSDAATAIPLRAGARRVLLSTRPAREGATEDGPTLELGPHEGIVLEDAS